jgi:hypothetical protein
MKHLGEYRSGLKRATQRDKPIFSKVLQGDIATLQFGARTAPITIKARVEKVVTVDIKRLLALHEEGVFSKAPSREMTQEEDDWLELISDALLDCGSYEEESEEEFLSSQFEEMILSAALDDVSHNYFIYLSLIEGSDVKK